MKRAFTLIELLVVLAVIGLLVALSFPAIKGVMSKSRMEGCASNMRQLGVAFNLYMADNDGRLPVSYVLGSNGADNNWWYRVSAYAGARRMEANWDSIKLRSMEPPFRCPENKGTDPVVTVNPWVSYKMSMRLRLIYSGTANNVTTGLPLLRLSDTARILLLAEGKLTPEFSEYTTASAATGVRYPHNNRLNGLFMDGHVENFAQEELKQRWGECYSFSVN